MKISKVLIDVIERDTGSLKVIDERSDIGGKTTQGVLRLLTDDGFGSEGAFSAAAPQ